MRTRFRMLSMALALAAAAWTAQGASAQALDMTGTWAFEVDSQGSITNPTLMLEQEGTSLTGHYSSATLGEADVTGSVAARTVTVNFSAVLEGVGEAPLTYAGDVNADGVWSGELTADFQGQMFPIGTFTATKQ